MRVLTITHTEGGTGGLLRERMLAAGHDVDVVDATREALPDLGGYDALTLLGGADDVPDAPQLPWMRAEIAALGEWVKAGRPVLGICLGAQLLAAASGAEVARAKRPEIGWHWVRARKAAREDPLFAGLPRRMLAYEWHSYAYAVPEGATELAANDVCSQAFRIGEKAYGVQFHPEVTVEILGRWFDTFRSDEDAVRLRFDAGKAREELPERLPGWQAVGTHLFDRFLEVAAR